MKNETTEIERPLVYIEAADWFLANNLEAQYDRVVEIECAIFDKLTEIAAEISKKNAKLKGETLISFGVKGNDLARITLSNEPLYIFVDYDRIATDDATDEKYWLIDQILVGSDKFYDDDNLQKVWGEGWYETTIKPKYAECFALKAEFEKELTALFNEHIKPNL